MRKLVVFLSLFLLLCIKAQSQNVDQIVIEKSPPPPGPTLCISSCQECGKLIFYSFIAGLKFESSLENIVEQKVETEVNEYGYQKFTYKVVTKALPIQHIIIKGPTVSNYDMEVTDLEPAACQYFIVNFKTTIPKPKTGSLLVKTIPSGATLTIKDEPQFSEPTPFLIKDHTSGNINIKLEKAGYITLDTTIIVMAETESEMTINLKPSYTPVKPVDQKTLVQTEIKKHSRNQTIWLASTVLAAGTGGYFMYAADQKYKEYQASNDSHAADLYDTAALYDKIKVACFGLAGFCAIEFTIQTVKKNKDKNQLNILMSGQGLKLTYNF
jgi:hypothetical protein